MGKVRYVEMVLSTEMFHEHTVIWCMAFTKSCRLAGSAAYDLGWGQDS